MKTVRIRSVLIVFLFTLQLVQPAFCQTQITGTWTGKFMNDFNAVIDLHSDDENKYAGTIQMYSGQQQIQNDALSLIKLNDGYLTFYIESKQTEFKGEFNGAFSELSGEFIFPDKSKHPIILVKSESIDKNVEENTKIQTAIDLDQTFSVSELQEDFDFLINNLKELHPNLYNYNSKENFDRLIFKTSESINSEISRTEFFKLIAPVVECIRCSHTGIRLPNEYCEEMNKHAVFLPIELQFHNEKAFFIKNTVNSTSMLLGDEVLAINKMPIQVIKEELFNFIPSEGSNSTTKNFYLNQNFNWLYHIIGPAESFEITYSRNGKNFVDTVNACTFSDFLKSPGNDKEVPLSFVLDTESSAAFLSIRSFMFPDINKYIQQMDSIFISLRQNNTKHLVIDLRGNAGGHPIFAAQLFSYLTNKEFTYFKRNNKVKDFEPLYNPMQPNRLQFDGNLYVLTDGGCLSTTGHLISLIKHHTNATFIGEEPGSSNTCNDFSVELVLPNSGILVNIPRTTFKTAIDNFQKNYPEIIDYQANSSFEDLVLERDSGMELAKHLIAKSSL